MTHHPDSVHFPILHFLTGKKKQVNTLLSLPVEPGSPQTPAPLTTKYHMGNQLSTSFTPSTGHTAEQKVKDRSSQGRRAAPFMTALPEARLQRREKDKKKPSGVTLTTEL